MGRWLTFFVLLTTFPAAALAADDPLCPTVVAGKSIGPFSVGMDAATAAKVKSPKKLYELYPLGGGKPLSGMGLDLQQAKCFVLGGKKISARLSPEAIALQIGGCGPAQPRTGGNYLPCQDGRVAVAWNQGSKSLRVYAAGEEKTKEVCDAYLVPGSHVVTVRDGERRAASGPVALTIEQGKRTCWWDHVVTSKWTPAEVWKMPGRSCAERKQGKETVLSCDYWGVRLFFKGTLQRLEVYPAKR